MANSINEFSQVCIAEGSVTVVQSATVSSVLDLAGTTLAAIIFPAAMTSTVVYLQDAGMDGADTPVTITGEQGTLEYPITVQAGKLVPVDPRLFLGVRHVKVLCGSAEAAARTIKLRCVVM